MKIAESKALTVNAPEFFLDALFLAWLNNGEPKFTWHNPGDTPNEYSDVVVMVDPSLTGDGADSDMPEQIWDQIVEACRVQFGALPRYEDHIMVRLVNVEA